MAKSIQGDMEDVRKMAEAELSASVNHLRKARQYHNEMTYRMRNTREKIEEMNHFNDRIQDQILAVSKLWREI